MVLDAGAAVELVILTSLGGRIARWLQRADGLATVAHCDLEVANVLRKLVLRGDRSDSQASQALDAWRRLPIVRHDVDVLMPRVWELRGNLVAFNAAYVALAESLGAGLVTVDSRLARAPGHGARIELIE